MNEIKLNEIQEELFNETIDEINEREKIQKEMLNEVCIKKGFIMNLVEKALFGKILKNIKIRVIVTWKDKTIFDYEIPKD